MTADSARPNIILIMTDDQGYGDLGCTGNPWIRTPEIDRFHDDAVRLPDFHVAPLCAPTRGAIMTGRRPVRNGVWSVCRGRSLLYTGQETIAGRFAAAGYRTGMAGKWHLGDNFPYRPHDRGFEWALYHKGGGVGQTPDHWGNNYFDDTYFENDEPKRFDGYCTDIWFEQAMRFIDADGGAAGPGDAAESRRPFFFYLSTNAPHDPYLVPDRYTEPYADNPDIPFPAFYGMIASLDENLARLRAFLRERGLEENTIVIFMTDNGSSGGCRLDEGGFITQGYNAGMRGKKGSLYEGGHRVPFFVRWPAGGWTGGRDVAEPGYDMDILPTLAGACGVEAGDGLDGRSLVPLLGGERERFDDERVHFVQFDMSAIDRLDKWHSAVLTRDWRLVHGDELYATHADPGQRRNVAADHPDVAERLRDAYEQWWSATGDGGDPYARIVLGDDHENPTRLDAFDVRGDVAYVQSLVASGKESGGRWMVDVARPGRYRVALRRWPEELDLPIDGDISPDAFDDLIIHWEGRSSAVLRPVRARLAIGETHSETDVSPGDHEAVFEIDLNDTGQTELHAHFVDADGGERGAYYVYVERRSA